MKLSITTICLIVAALANGTIAKGYDHQESTLSDSNSNHVDQRRGGLKGAAARHLQDKEEEDTSMWYPAEPLDYFRLEMDPGLFEWVNPDEIVEGGTTCGFLSSKLGTTPKTNFPSVKVYVCMRFADIQPAKKGHLFIHCGGPGSLSGCLSNYIGVGAVSAEHLEDYNLISIDQVSVAERRVLVFSFLPTIFPNIHSIAFFALPIASHIAWNGALVPIVCSRGVQS
jgi:hypothetical protein